MTDSPRSITEAPIGVFDSGVGGLSVLRHIREQLPNESLIYISDNAFLPYGDKSPEQVRERVFYLAERLLGMGAKALVVACNTATAAAIHPLREHYPHLPIIGMEPGIKPALQHSKSGKVGILATSGTLTSGKFASLLERYGDGAEVLLQPCPGLVEQVEKGELQGGETKLLLANYIQPLLNQGVDALVLGCTHYPFLLSAIQQICGDTVTVVDTGEAVSRQVERRLSESGLLNQSVSRPVYRFYASASFCDQRFLRQLWPDEIEFDCVTNLDVSALYC